MEHLEKEVLQELMKRDSVTIERAAVRHRLETHDGKRPPAAPR